MPVTNPVSKTTLVRSPAVAGVFYPDDPEKLNRELTRLLQEATPSSTTPPPQILIVPHAGIAYSGGVAAAGFRQIENKNYAKIILLGASHHQYFTHAAVYTTGRWTTPLGQVPIHPELAQTLSDKEKDIIPDPTPHVPEHDLEVEVIFLQKILKDFQIVPILVSQPSEQLVEALAQKIAANFDEQTLLVVSTDLSHYPNGETAREVDNRTIQAILTGRKATLEETVAHSEGAGHVSLDTAACGFQALRVALRVAEIMQIKNWQKLKYENSGDITGDQTRVVGYAAIAGYGSPTRRVEELNPTGFPRRDSPAILPFTAQQEALALARRTLENYFATGQIPFYSPQHAVLHQFFGVFTTLRKNGQLRGCRGEFAPQKPLYQVIQSTAISAALRDPRFPPLTADELPKIKMEISVLTPKKRIADWREIQLGQHGVILQKGGRAGTFLPQVAAETGWNLEQFLGQLCLQKADLPADGYKDPTINLYTFEAQVFGED